MVPGTSTGSKNFEQEVPTQQADPIPYLPPVHIVDVANHYSSIPAHP